jgi:hypothetical protein
MILRGVPGGPFLVLPGILFLLSALLETRDDPTGQSKLGHELTGYLTTAQRRDIAASLDRYPDDVTCELRDIIARSANQARQGDGPAHLGTPPGIQAWQGGRAAGL